LSNDIKINTIGSTSIKNYKYIMEIFILSKVKLGYAYACPYGYACPILHHRISASMTSCIKIQPELSELSCSQSGSYRETHRSTT